MKRIITIQDISCVGRCSLTVALPIISAAGVEACILPTAVLSTHTAFPEFTFRDLTDEILSFLCDFIYNRTDHPAWTAPIRIKIEKYGLVGIFHFILKIIFIDFDN